ncbi:hypothetical protein HOD61_01670 [archaeon]|jgi:hypothetical protein|nr:hypothetical protein [archaeon]
MDIRKGDIMEIRKGRYAVLNILEDIDEVDTKEDKLIGEHTAIELHKFGNSSLFATHLLKIYYDNDREGILSEIEYEKISKKLENPLFRGTMITYHNKTQIPISDIKIETTQ